MDELEWLKANSPSTQPSRDTTRRHRTELRAAIAAEGAEGRSPRRNHPRRRARHRVLVTAAIVVAVCAVGAGIVALSTKGDDEGGRVGAPAASGSTSTTTQPMCSGQLPLALKLPAGFRSGEAGPAPESSDPVESGQQVTHWSSGKATIELRWPADAALRPPDVNPPQEGGGVSGISDNSSTVDDKGVAHRRAIYTFDSVAGECATIEVTVYGTDPSAVNSVADEMFGSPFRSTEPLVTTTQAAASAPAATPCPGPVNLVGTAVNVSEVKVVPTVGGTVARGIFDQPQDALADFVASQRYLYQHGYQELRLADGSLSYVAEPRPGVVVAVVHVTATTDGWTVSNWSASGC